MNVCKILNKRLPRNFKRDLLSNLLVMALIIVGLSVVTGGAIGNLNIMQTNAQYQKEDNLEDGSFSMLNILEKKDIETLKKSCSYFEEQFYKDVKLDKNKTLRLFENREHVNKIHLDKGALATKETEIVLEKHFSEANDYNIGDTININQITYEVSGIGSVADYNYVKKNISDLSCDTENFSIAFVTKDSFQKFEELSIYHYAYSLKDNVTNYDLKEKVVDMGVVTQFNVSEDNSRITSYRNDCSLMKNASLISGVLFMILMAYIIAVFTSNTIEREEVVIGTLYSLGVQKLELIRHYMKLPLLMVFISAIIGLIFGMFGMSDLLASDSVALYSMPELEVHTNIWIFIYAIVMPIAITIIVNFLVLNKKLSRKPIDMLRKNRSLSLRNFGKLEKVRFKDAFRFRQFTSEIGSNLILIGGIFIASLLLVLGFTIEHSMDKYVENVTNDLEYQYQYVVAGPVDTIPEGAEAVYDKMLTHQSSSELDVVLEGIESKSEYFSFAIEAMEKEVYISDAFAKKFGYVVGDRITLVDNLENEEYSFKVAKIVPYNYGLYIFMNIDQMRQYFDEEEGYYNGILSKKKLSLPEDMVISTTSQKNVIESAEALKSNMSMMMLIMDGLGLIIFALVLFLLVKLIITKASFSISLIKIFGYKLSEVITIYLGSTTCIVLLGVVVSVPVSNVIMGKIYPFFTANIPAYIESGLNTEMFIYLIVYMLVVYLLVNVFLVKQLSKIRYTQILKDRE